MKLGWFLLALVILLWGAGPLAISVGVGSDGGFGPLWMNGTRLALAGGLMLVVAALRGRRLWVWRDLPLLLVLGLVGWSLGSGLQVIAQREASSGLAALVLSMGPGMTLAFDAAARRRVPPMAHLVGCALGVLGVGMIAGQDGGAASLGSILLLLAAAACWAIAAVMQSQRGLHAAPSVSAGWQMLAGGGGLIAAAAGIGEAVPDPTVMGFAAWTYLAIGGAFIGFLAWVEVLRRLPVLAAMSQPTLSTLVAVALGYVVLGERLGPLAPLGILLIVVGAGATLLPESVWAQVMAVPRRRARTMLHASRLRAALVPDLRRGRPGPRRAARAGWRAHGPDDQGA